jgi:tetratricopeptide (TPR) repeat protein
MSEETSRVDHYERGLLMKKVQMFDSALQEFQQATKDPQEAGKAFAQVALCLRSLKRDDEAVMAFRHALETDVFSTKERVHILYWLGQTLESLNRDFEALVVYRRIRRDAPNFEDVDARIQELSSRPLETEASPPPASCVETDVVNLWEQVKPQLASLARLTWQRLAAYAERLEPPRRGNSLPPPTRSVSVQKVQREKRRHARVAVQLSSQFYSRTQMVVAGAGQLRDLSPGGCRMTSPVRVPLGTALECWIYPQAGHPFAVEEATVQWSGQREFGLVFTKMRPSVQRQITDLCRKVAPL